MFLFAMLILLVFGFSMMGCSDSGGSNPLPDSPSHIALFGYSNPSVITNISRFSTTILEDSGAKLGPQLAGNIAQYDWWCKATSFSIGGEQYVFSQECGDRWMITSILRAGHLGARTDSGSWETYEVILSFKIGSQQFIFCHGESGDWKIMEILPGGKMGTQTDSGHWENFYETMVAFQMSDGRAYVFGQNEGGNDWFIREILPGGKMETRTDQGHMEEFYKTMVTFQMSDWRTYVFGQNQGGNDWFIREILSGGKMGPQTDQGQMGAFYKTTVAYQVDNKQFLFGQHEDSNDWFIQEILEGGIMGNQTDEGQMESFYDIAFPVSYDPLYLTTWLWMTETYQTIKDRPLKEIVIPGSHDSGMCETQKCQLGNACNTQTQNADLYRQLHNGVRYMDLRPVLYHKGCSDEKWYLGHFEYISVLGMVGCNGQTLDSALQNIEDFFADIGNENKELLILNFSHCYEVGGCDANDGSDSAVLCDKSDWDELIYKKVIPALKKYKLSLPCYTDISCRNLLVSLPYEKLIENGGHIIFRISAHHNVIPSDASLGIIIDDYFPIYNEYSNTNDLDDMITNQIDKLLNGGNHIDDNGSDQLFLLSWTLTLSKNQVAACYFGGDSILHYAREARTKLFPKLDELLNAGQIAGPIVPNILYTDDTDQTGTNAAVYLNQNLKFPPTDPKMGYWILDSKATPYHYGNAINYGGGDIGAAAVDIGVTPTGKGYWILDEKGQIYCAGDAEYHCFGNTPVPVDAVAIGVNPKGWGYWILDKKGQIYNFGDAQYYGNAPLSVTSVDIGVTPTGEGYWILDEKGQIYCTGDAEYHCFGNAPLSVTSVAIGVTPTGWGYWILDNMGQIYCLGDAVPYCFADHSEIPDSVDIGVTPTGKGWWIMNEKGQIYAAGDAEYDGGGVETDRSAVAIGVNPILGDSSGSTTE